jgi:hypothetical protein
MMGMYLAVTLSSQYSIGDTPRYNWAQLLVAPSILVVVQIRLA